MKTYIPILKKCQLFANMEEHEILTLLSCLNAKKQHLKKEEAVLLVGDTPTYVGIVLSGGVHIIQEDYWGNQSILSAIHAGGLFAEAFSCAEIAALPVSVITHTDSEILLVDCKRILTTCSSSCIFHTTLIHNLMYVLANKNIMLTRKMEHITKKTTREKVLSYLSECAVLADSNTFEIPFNRQELANYLSVERSALSSTLAKMRDEGMLQFNKNVFTLHT